MTIKRLAIPVLAIVAIAAAYFFLFAPKSPPASSGVTKVRVAQTGDFLLYAGLYVAVDGGFFEKHGLQVDISNTGGDEKSAAAVLSGNAEFGVGDPTFAPIANARGQNLKVVASLVSGAPFWGVTYKPEVEARYKATGLKGLTVATFPAPSTAYTLQAAMFKKAGLPVSIKEGAFGSLQGILEAGQADIALELEPNVSTAGARGGLVLYSMAALNGNLAITGAVVNGQYAASHPNVVRGFCSGLRDAYAFIRNDPKKATQLLAARFKDLPPAIISAALTRMITENIIPSDPRTDPAAWSRAIGLRVQVGDIKDQAAAEAALDNSYCS